MATLTRYAWRNPLTDELKHERYISKDLALEEMPKDGNLWELVKLGATVVDWL